MNHDIHACNTKCHCAFAISQMILKCTDALLFIGLRPLPSHTVFWIISLLLHCHLTFTAQHCWADLTSQINKVPKSKGIGPTSIRHSLHDKYWTSSAHHVIYIYIWVVWLRKMWNGDTLQENTRITIWANMHTCKHYNTWITSHVQLGIRTKPSRRTAHEMLVRHQAILARDVLHALHDLMWDTD